MTNTLPEEYVFQDFTETVRFRLLYNGVVHYTFLGQKEIDESRHMANHVKLCDIADHKKVLLLIDSVGYQNITPEAKKLIRDLELVVPIDKRAIVIKTLGERILVNFYLSFYKPIIVTRAFTNYKEALDWLLVKKKDA